LAREPLADAFFGFPDTQEVDLAVVTNILEFLEAPALVVDKDLRVVAANLQGRDTLAWLCPATTARGREADVLPEPLAGLVAARIRKRVHEIVRNVALLRKPSLLYDVFVSKGRVRGETYTFVVLLDASMGRKASRVRDLERLLGGFRAGAFVLDDDVAFAAVNDAFLDLIGFTREEIVGRHMNDFNTSEQATAYGRIFRGLIASPGLLLSPTVTYATLRRGAFVSPMTAWTLSNRDGEALGLAVVGGFPSRPQQEAAGVERRHVLLEKAADLMSEAILVTDLDGNILVKNPAADCLLEGAKAKETPNIKTDIRWEIPETIENAFAGLAAGREQSIFNTSVLMPSHRAIVKVKVFGLKRVSDIVQEVLFVCDDITQEEYLKETVFQTTRRLADDRAVRDKVLDSVGIPYAVVDRDLTFIEINEATARRLGSTKRDLIGRKVTEINPNVERSGMADRIRRAIDTGEPLREPGFAHITGAGAKLAMELVLVPVEVGGRRACVVIAESERAPEGPAPTPGVSSEAAVAGAVMGAVSEGVLIVDRDGTIVDANDGFTKGSSIPREDIVGKTIGDLIAMSDDAERFAAAFRLIGGGFPQRRDQVTQPRGRQSAIRGLHRQPHQGP